MGFDPRLTPARPDLAAARLKGEVAAERYAEPVAMAVAVPLAPVTGRPDAAAPQTTQLLAGERFAAYELARDWAWGQAEADGYVGYVPAASLAPAGTAPTHRVCQPMTHVYPEPLVRARPTGWLPYGARVVAGATEKAFTALAGGGFVPARHLAPLGQRAADWVAEAERFLGAPYLWGGRSVRGVDCSGLVQLALNAAGLPCPRDSDMQAAALGRTLPEGTPPRRGDLVFWKGHVGILLDGTRMLHANGHAMAVSIEDLEAAKARILAAGEGAATRHARLDGAPGGG